MKNKLLLLTLILLGSLLGFSTGDVCKAQSLTAERAFIESPDYVFPVLNGTTKKDMVDLYHAVAAGKSHDKTTSNLAGDAAQILSLTPSLIHLTLDSDTDVQIKLLPMLNNTSLICMVVTSLVDTPQSIIKFYSWDWKEVESKDVLPLPTNSDFLIQPADAESMAFKNAMVERGMMTYEARFVGDQPRLTFRMSTFDSKEAQALHAKLLPKIKKEGISYDWTGSRFKRNH